MEYKLDNGLIIYIDKIIEDPSDNSRYLLFYQGKEIGRWYVFEMPNEVLHDLIDLLA